MELFSNLSDDQIALLGCATALVSTGSIMCLSYFIGRGRLQKSAATTTAISNRTEEAAAADAAPSKHRSAA